MHRSLFLNPFSPRPAKTSSCIILLVNGEPSGGKGLINNTNFELKQGMLAVQLFSFFKEYIKNIF